MKTAVLWIFGLGIVIALAAIIWSVFSTTEEPTTSTPVTFPAGNNATSTPNTTATIATADGSAFETNTFLANPTTAADPVNTGYYYLGYHSFENDPSSTQSPPYMIEYISQTQYFNIALLQEPLRATREAAEQYLMQQLGITESQMCRLKYDVTVPNSVNPYFASKSLGFSFCPGATQLPQ